MGVSAAKRKKLVWLAAAGVAATLGVCGLNHRPLVSRAVTWLALRDAERMASPRVADEDFENRVVRPLAKKYDSWFRRGFFDRSYLVSRFPAGAVTGKALPAWTVAIAQFQANKGDFSWSREGEEAVLEEVKAWLDPVLLSSASREALVNALTSDYTLLGNAGQQAGGLPKREIFNFLFAASGDRSLEKFMHRCLALLKERHWQAIVNDCDHPREKVRAGALLLLFQHPSRELCLAKARAALGDSSAWVRIAAAGTLAFSGDFRGAEHLIEGLEDERWEVRFWCGFCLAAKKNPRYVYELRIRRRGEMDSWVRKSFDALVDASGVFPAKEWERLPPADAGLDPAALEAFSAYLGGRGCVVRLGFLVHTWGDPAQRGDIASACKPMYTHFLFKALEDRRFGLFGLFGSLDNLVSRFEPRLETLNASLGHKDSKITWRHLANQVSCYGVAEESGAAFDYSDYNMALLFDTLLLNAFNVTAGEVDKEVLHARLTDHLQCQDAPTFFAFGPDDRPGRIGISPRDLARFGLLYLSSGKWNGRQLLKPEHVAEATTSPLPNSIPRTRGEPAEMIPGQRSIGGKNNQTDHLGSYSFAWWTNGVDRDGKRHWPDAPADTYAALGHGGMRALVIIPSLDLIASWNDTRVETREMENEALGKLLKAVVKR